MHQAFSMQAPRGRASLVAIIECFNFLTLNSNCTTSVVHANSEDQEEGGCTLVCHATDHCRGGGNRSLILVAPGQMGASEESNES